MGKSTGDDDAWPPGLDAGRLLDALDDAVIALEPSGRIVVWNPAAERLFGVTVTTARGALRSLVEPVEDPPGWFAGVCAGRPQRFRGFRADGRGRRLEFDIAASPVLASDGTVAGVVQILRPAPEAMPVERERTLRASLTGLLQPFELLSRTSLDREQQELVRSMRAAADSVLALLDGPEPSVPPMHVLLAEDDEVSRMLLSRVLAQAGHRVDEVADGREALRAVVRTDYDVILMDMQMPVMDGLEATRAIRTLPGRSAEVPIIAVTADTAPERQRGYFDAGVDALLTKPVDWQLLNRSLGRLRRGDRFAAGWPPPELVPPSAGRPSPASPPRGLPPVFDRDRIEEGLGVLPPGRVAAMLAMLPVEVRRRLEEYREAMQLQDLGAARRAAHTLKGLAANFGAARLEVAARAAEAACGSLPAAQAALADMEDAVRRTAEAAVGLSASFQARG